MSHEIETKVLDINVRAITQNLRMHGAVRSKKERLVVDWYRLKGITEGEDPWFLRIRSYSGKRFEVTWKAKSNTVGIVRKHKEINFSITEARAVADLFEEIGLEQYAHQEKDRISFRLKGWQFDIDQYPGMPAFVEIEGHSEVHIKKAMQLLGICDKQTWTRGERILIQDVYHLDWYSMKF